MTGHDRKTVRKCPQMDDFSPEAPAPWPRGPSKLDPFEDYMDCTPEASTDRVPITHATTSRASPPSSTIARMNTAATHPAAPTHPETDTPLVSVMVPVYNVERYLPQCLDSILAQDYQNLDILLVDDGSTDGCGAMCDSCASRDPLADLPLFAPPCHTISLILQSHMRLEIETGK